MNLVVGNHLRQGASVAPPHGAPCSRRPNLPCRWEWFPRARSCPFPAVPIRSPSRRAAASWVKSPLTAPSASSASTFKQELAWKSRFAVDCASSAGHSLPRPNAFFVRG